VRIAVRLYRQFAQLVHELAKFGVIGAFNFVLAIVISDTLHLGLGVGPLTSFGLATAVATTFSYFANRYWTFRHRDTSGLGREYMLFFVFNGVGLVISWLFIGVTHYVLGITSGLAYNVSLVVGTGAATLFRYWAYKKWVFLPASLPPVDAHTGLPEAEGDTEAAIRTENLDADPETAGDAADPMAMSHVGSAQPRPVR
jgi:putative flippase GtrA